MFRFDPVLLFPVWSTPLHCAVRAVLTLSEPAQPIENAGTVRKYRQRGGSSRSVSVSRRDRVRRSLLRGKCPCRDSRTDAQRELNEAICSLARSVCAARRHGNRRRGG